LDQTPYEVIDALAFQGVPTDPRTYAHPLRFVAMDGKTYWVKYKAQHGLAAELIAGRLAASLGVGPASRVIRVSEMALPAQKDVPLGVNLAKYVGEMVGSEDVRGAENARDLEEFMIKKEFAPGIINAESRAAVTTFQTWIGAKDQQVLVRLTDGKVLSIDHGDCFGATDRPTEPQVVIELIPGVPGEVGRERNLVESAVIRIEALSDDDLLDAVDRVPVGPHWQSDVTRRLAIAEWLAYRRDRLREVMLAWAV
jgi:hypothetical protein